MVHVIAILSLDLANLTVFVARQRCFFHTLSYDITSRHIRSHPSFPFSHPSLLASVHSYEASNSDKLSLGEVASNHFFVWERRLVDGDSDGRRSVSIIVC